MFPDVNSTFSKEQYQNNLKRQSILVSTPKINVVTLKEVFEKYISKNTQIDLLSVDTEGHDLEVLKSNDWRKYRPTVICTEIQSTISLHQYLIKLGYKLVTKTPINCLYVEKNSPILSRPTAI
jgi:hypothetical protein